MRLTKANLRNVEKLQRSNDLKQLTLVHTETTRPLKKINHLKFDCFGRRCVMNV